MIPEDLLGKVPSFNEEIGEAPPEEGTPLSVDIVQEEPAPEAPAPIEDLSPDWAKATGAYARLAARSFRALEAPPEERDASMSSLRRAIVEIVSGMARTAFEDRILALTAAPVAEDARARHAANTAIFAVAAARACGVVKLALVDVGIAAALHDEGEAELLGKGDTWPRSVGRAISGAISDAAILHVVTAYEKTGARGTPARPAPQSKKTRLESRIIACACAFDEKTRAGGTTVETLEQLAAAGHDPAATRALSTALGKFPRGVLVSLSPLGHLGVVLACGARRDDKPRVRIFADEKGEPVDAREVEVGSARDLSVDRVVDPKKLGVSPLAHLLAWG